MVDTASSTLLATINQALLLEQGITIVGEPFEQNGQWMVGVQNDRTRSSYAVPIAELPQLACFSTPGVLRSDSAQDFCSAENHDYSMDQCTTDPDIFLRQSVSCDPTQRQEGELALRYVLKNDPEEVAAALKHMEQNPPPEGVETIKGAVQAAMHEVASEGPAGRQAVTQFASAVKSFDPELSRLAVAEANRTTLPPPASMVAHADSIPPETNLLSPSGISPAAAVRTTSLPPPLLVVESEGTHPVSSGGDQADTVPIGSLTISSQRVREIFIAATSLSISNGDFFETILPSPEGGDRIETFLSGLGWTQSEVEEQVLGPIRQGIAGLLQDLPEAHRPPRSDGRSPDTGNHRLEFFYHHNDPRSGDSIEIAKRPPETPHLDPFEESGLLEGGGLSYGRRHTAAGFGVFSFFSKALERSEGDSGAQSVFVPVPPNFFAMTEPRRGIFAPLANPRGDHATERATARIEGNPQPSDHEGRDRGGRGEGGRHGRDGHHGHGGHDEENPDDPYATWSETAPEEPATASA